MHFDDYSIVYFCRMRNTGSCFYLALNLFELVSSYHIRYRCHEHVLRSKTKSLCDIYSGCSFFPPLKKRLGAGLLFPCNQARLIVANLKPKTKDQ